MASRARERDANSPRATSNSSRRIRLEPIRIHWRMAARLASNSAVKRQARQNRVGETFLSTAGASPSCQGSATTVTVGVGTEPVLMASLAETKAGLASKEK